MSVEADLDGGPAPCYNAGHDRTNGERPMKYFLYGHYDSRGGATLIEDETKEAASARYLESFWCEDNEWGTKADQEKQIIEDDFIAEVTFTSYREVEDGEDLEQGRPIPSEEDDAQKANAYEDGLAWATEEIVQTTPNPFRELLWARYEGEKVVELRLCPKEHSPAYEDQTDRQTPFYHHYGKTPGKKEEGWKRASFGEDAYGVILMKK